MARAAPRAPRARRRPRDRALRGRHASVEPVAGAADHRHAALPPKRRGARATSSGGTTPSASTSTSGSAAPTGRSGSRTRCAAFCPTCSRSRRARRSSRASTPASRRPAPRSSRACFRAAACPTSSGAGLRTRSTSRFLYRTGSITEHTQLWWSVRPHLAFPTVEIRICDGQPELGESQALAALMYALTARIARALDEGEPLPDHPHRLIEENFWRATRYGLSGELIRLGTDEVRPGPRGAWRARRVGPAGRRGARLRAASPGPGREPGRAADRASRGGGDDGGDLRPGGAGGRACLSSRPRSRKRSQRSSSRRSGT